MRLAAALIASLVLALPATAQADALLPPAGKVFAGVAGGYDASSFERETGRHPAIFQFFSGWGGSLEYMFRGAEDAQSRLMIHISADRGAGEVITPKGIAIGRGDGYLLRLGARIAEGGRPVYIRLMSEMNNFRNYYCAYELSGRRRGVEHTTRWYRQAWRRTVLVLRGGPVARINARLRRLHLPPVDTRRTELASPQVSFLWVPMTRGTPDTRANSPRAYWPGSRYVDWVGTDFYSKFPNWLWLEQFYRQFGGKPFVFGEWALWGRDDAAFVHRMFRWARSHRRVRMLVYNQGVRDRGPFRLVHYPRGRRALRSELRSSRFAQFTPDYRR